jgi:hypothetical protein
MHTCLLLLSGLSVFAVKILGDLPSKEEAFATDEHGITRKSRIKAFSPRRRKERKGRQEIQTCLLLLSGLCVLAVKILGSGGF